MDLLNELRSQDSSLYISGLVETTTLKSDPDQLFVLSDKGSHLDEEFLPVCYILPAQMIGYFKSLHLGLNPDNPSTNGAISRVVKGVVIYPFTNTK